MIPGSRLALAPALVFGLGLLGAAAASAQAAWIRARTEIRRPESGLRIGVPFTLVVEASHPPGGVALLPSEIAWPDTLAERSAARRHLRRTEGDAEIDRYELELVPFEIGEIEVPSLELAFGSTQTRTRAQILAVESNLSPEEQAVAGSTLAEALAELERLAAPDPGPRTIRVDDHRPWYAAGGLIAALALGFGLMFAQRRLRRLARPVLGAAAAPPPRPAHELALERLEALRGARRLAEGDVKGHWSELSEILRWYVGARYAFESLDLTTAELLGELRDRRTPGLDLAALERTLQTADLVKYAKARPADAEASHAMDGAFALVEATQPRETEGGTAGEGGGDDAAR